MTTSTRMMTVKAGNKLRMEMRLLKLRIDRLEMIAGVRPAFDGDDAALAAHLRQPGGNVVRLGNSPRR